MSLKDIGHRERKREREREKEGAVIGDAVKSEGAAKLRHALDDATLQPNEARWVLVERVVTRVIRASNNHIVHFKI